MHIMRHLNVRPRHVAAILIVGLGWPWAAVAVASIIRALGH